MKKTIVTSIALIIGSVFILYFLNHHANINRQIAVNSIKDTVKSHSSQIALILSNMYQKDVNTIEEAIYKELQTGRSTSLIKRSHVTVDTIYNSHILRCLLTIKEMDLERFEIVQGEFPKTKINGLEGTIIPSEQFSDWKEKLKTKAVHRAYARSARMKLPALEVYEQKMIENILPMTPQALDDQVFQRAQS
jgi:hypothetical protein